MMMNELPPESFELAKESFEFADSYLKTVIKVFRGDSRKFDNDLLYNMISITFEKFMIGWLACYDEIASSHLPLMLYRELKPFEPDLSEDIRKTAILIGSFEGICSIEDFGYKTPTDIQIEKMIVGLNDVRAAVSSKIASIERA